MNLRITPVGPRLTPQGSRSRLKRRVDWSDVQVMEQPVMRDGTWWQRHGDHWYRWNPDNQQWEIGTAPPPPPPPAPAPPPGPVASAPMEQPARAYTGSGKPVENVDGGNTWSSVTINNRPVEAAGWSDSELPITPTKRVPPAKLAALGFAALAVAVLFGAYTYFFSGDGAPSDEDIDAAFTSLNGYEYQEPPEGLQDQIDAALEKNPELTEYVSSVDFRMLQRRDRLVGAVGVIGYEPGQFGDEAFDPRENQAFMAGFNQTSGMNLPGASLKTVTRGNTIMYEIRGGGAALITFIDDDEGMIFSIATSDPRSARKISEQLALANL
ncbi:hypothetical protein BH20ACT23_BH20ACT23_06050 [soil metagenome]